MHSLFFQGISQPSCNLPKVQLLSFLSKIILTGQDLIDLNGCVQSKSIMLAMIAEAWDTGISRQSLDLQIASGTWPTDQDQDSGYLACIQNCIMPESYLEPCIVRHLIQIHQKLIYTSIIGCLLFPSKQMCLIVVDILKCQM